MNDLGWESNELRKWTKGDGIKGQGQLDVMTMDVNQTVTMVMTDIGQRGDKRSV